VTWNIDADVNNADWTKGRTWDIYADDGPVTTVKQLKEVFPGRTNADLKAMLKLPSARAMPTSLKTELTLLPDDAHGR